MLDRDCLAFVEKVKRSLRECGTPALRKQLTKILDKSLDKTLVQFERGQVETINLVDVFEVTEQAVKSQQVVDSNKWAKNPFKVKVWKRTGKKTTGNDRVGWYIPKGLQMFSDSRHHMYFTTDRACSAANPNYVQFIQKFMDDYWPKQKFKDQREAKQWIWNSWEHKTNHPIAKEINDAYMEIFNRKQHKVWYPNKKTPVVKTRKRGPPKKKAKKDLKKNDKKVRNGPPPRHKKQRLMLNPAIPEPIWPVD